MFESYTVLPAFYDLLGKHPDYETIAGVICDTYQKQGAKESGLFLDLCCGTGKLLSALIDRGADVIGVDRSPEMLNVARANCRKKKRQPLLLCQDMRDLDLYGTVDVCVCASNSLNYLQSTADLSRVFSLIHNFLTPGGLFFFDIDSLYKFERLYADNCYVFETGDCFCVWQNDYRPSKRECVFLIDLFERTGEEVYRRRSEWQKQKFYSERTVERLLRTAGFELLTKGADYRGAPLGRDSADLFYLAKCVKA